MIRSIILKEKILVNKPASVTIRELKIGSIFLHPKKDEVLTPANS